MLVLRHVFPVVAALLLLLAGVVPGTGQAAFPAPAEAPKPPALPGQNNPAAAGPAKPGAAPSSTLQTKKAPRTPTASSLGLPSSPTTAGTSAAAPQAAPASTPAGNATKIVRLYRGPGHFDEKLAGQLKLALQEAFDTEPDSKNQPADGPGSPAGTGTGPGKIAQASVKAD
ncbi:MAG: hypothetical protein JOY92_12875 [Verrucomicrobia bacterium]|nr:hypothetical protein [Verrucomicrobiota bacterium]